ncbi:MAG: hypothetical protein ACM3QS_13145 [Bacteroidota bacterium]
MLTLILVVAMLLAVSLLAIFLTIVASCEVVRWLEHTPRLHAEHWGNRPYFG